MPSGPLLARLELFRKAVRERGWILPLLASDNDRFLKYAPPGHFYSSIPDFHAIVSKSDALFDRSVSSLPGIELNEAGQLDLARKLGSYSAEIPFPARQTATARYHFDNPYFSYGDAVSLYSMIRHFKPKQIVEVGSGFSSAAMLDVSDRFFDGDIGFTFIEPHPQRLHGLLNERDRERCEIREEPVQEVPGAVFESLAENDFLFIDSSHVGKIGSDVLHLLFEVLPSLKPGVLIHFHDILWPFEYPRVWLEEGRAWNEAYLVRSFLQYNRAFRILYFNSYLETHHRELLQSLMPAALKLPSSGSTPGNTSLWLQKTS